GPGPYAWPSGPPVSVLSSRRRCRAESDPARSPRLPRHAVHRARSGRNDRRKRPGPQDPEHPRPQEDWRSMDREIGRLPGRVDPEQDPVCRHGCGAKPALLLHGFRSKEPGRAGGRSGGTGETDAMKRGAPQIGGVVFDLDGTLVDTMPFVIEGLTAAVAPYRSRPTPEEVMSRLGGPSDACVRRLLGGTRHLSAALSAYLGFLRQHEQVAPPFRGARALLKFLRSKAVRIGLWTGRERGSTLERLRAFSWEEVFDPVVCGDDLPSH